MKKLINNILLFVLPIALLVIMMPNERRSQYIGLKDDCFNHGIWIHDRIHLNEKDIDIAFLGSSHTINGFNDQMISKSLSPLVATNFGYCRLGRNLHYVILKEIISQKNINTLVLEVREEEDRYSHPVFPFLAGSKDVLLPNPFFNRDILSDMWNHLGYKIELWQDKIYEREPEVAARLEDYGYAYHTDTASAELLDRIRLERSNPRYKATGLEARFHNNFPAVYLNKIARTCSNNNIKLYFIYFPSYATPYEKPALAELYMKYGELIIPPKEIFADQDNWYDENHLNKAGASKLSAWIIDILKQKRGSNPN